MDVGLDCLYPDEAGAFFTQLCYDVMRICSDKFNRFEYLCYLVKRDQSGHDTITQLKARWNAFLETCPLIDIITSAVTKDSKIKVILTLLKMITSEYTMINTAIFLFSKITTQKFEYELYVELLEIVNNLPCKYKDWGEKIQSLHINWMKNRINTSYEMNKQERTWLEKEMNWKYTNKNEEREEFDMFIRKIIDNL